MFITEKKARAKDLDYLADHLPVWRFVKERCFECNWEGVGLVPYDLESFRRNNCQCLNCKKMVAKVVGVLIDFPAHTVVEARRNWEKCYDEYDSNELTSLPLLIGLGEDTNWCQRGVRHLVHIS